MFFCANLISDATTQPGDPGSTPRASYGYTHPSCLEFCLTAPNKVALCGDYKAKPKAVQKNHLFLASQLRLTLLQFKIHDIVTHKQYSLRRKVRHW
eukprot:1160426-Pelagomonas_calceolata.AAC.2